MIYFPYFSLFIVSKDLNNDFNDCITIYNNEIKISFNVLEVTQKLFILKII